MAIGQNYKCLKKHEITSQHKKTERQKPVILQNLEQGDIFKDMDFYHLLEIHLTNTMKPPNRGHPKQRTCHEQQTKHLVPNVTIFFKLPPNSGHLSIMDKFFKNPCVHSGHWGINPLLPPQHPSFLASPCPLKSTNCPSPSFQTIPPIYWFFKTPPLLKN